MEQNKFYQIKNVTEHEYTLVGCDGSVIIRPIQDVDKSASVFTIEDAEDGDVLYSHEHNLLWIYKYKDAYHVATNLNYTHNISIGGDIAIPSDVCPATKEQRDLLFARMKGAGYEWNTDEKVLNKVIIYE